MASSTPSLPQVRVLEQSSVSPPKGSVPEASIPLSFIDVLWLPAGSVERLFFYRCRHSTSHFIHHIIPRLKSSLALILQIFYLLASEVRLIPDSDNMFEYHYKDGDSVAFAVAESDDDFDQLSGNHQRDYARFKPLTPNLAISFGMGPVLAVQVTLFPSHGICVGVAVNHAVCDGTSNLNFVKSWAATCRSAAGVAVVADPPLYDRSVLVDPNNLLSTYVHVITKFKAIWDQIRPKPSKEDDVVLSTFLLRREEIEKLKQKILAQNERGKVPFHCSAFVATCAFVWTCLIRSRGWPSERSAHMGFPVDARPLLKPPVPHAYFGNCIGSCRTELKVRDILADDGIGCAAEAIGRAIERVKDGVLKGAEEWPQVFRSTANVQSLSIAGSPKFGVYETDFGWGKPVKVEISSIGKTGAMSLSDAKDGGIEIGFALSKSETDEFTACFANGLKTNLV